MTVSILYIGAEWCKTCKTILPRIEEVAKKFQVSLSKKDFDTDLTDEEQASISKVPTIYIMEGEKRIVDYSSNQVESVDTWLRTNMSVDLQKTEDF